MARTPSLKRSSNHVVPPDEVSTSNKRRESSAKDLSQNEPSVVFADPSIIHLVTEDLWEEDNRVLVEDALVKLANLCCQGTVESLEQRVANVTLSLRAGAQVAVIRAMKNYCSTADIQEYACTALMNLCHDNPDCCAAVSAAGGIEAILSAAKRFPEHESLQACACGVLMNLVYTRSHKNLALQISNLGGIQIIVAAMRANVHDTELLEYACGLLDNLCLWEEMVGPIVKAGGLSALGAAIENHGDSVGEIKEYASHAMQMLLQNF